MTVEIAVLRSDEWVSAISETVKDRIISSFLAFERNPNSLYWEFKYKGELLASFSKREGKKGQVAGILIRFLGPDGYEEVTKGYE